MGLYVHLTQELLRGWMWGGFFFRIAPVGFFGNCFAARPDRSPLSGPQSDVSTQ